MQRHVIVPLETSLFILRILIAVLLYAFLGALLWMIWRDFRITSAQLDATQRRMGQLVVVESDVAEISASRIFSLLSLTTLGRAPTNSVVLADSSASGEHALIARRGSQWWLEDRHSRNGTTLNGQFVEEPVVVSTGDIIGVGRVRLRLELD
jgi:pSer/pThr/pTyr-binding forkhead associated (FHA) protein